MNFQLENIELEVFLGVPKEERSQKQVILVSVCWKLDTEKAQRSDDIADSVDYYEIYQLVKNFGMGRQFKLIETLYSELYQAILDKFSVHNLKISINKFPFEDAIVTVST